MTPPRGGRIVPLLIVVVAVVLASGAYLLYAPRRVPEGQKGLVHLDSGSLGTLRDDFNAAGGGTRLLVLLSPT
jgi:hypothetical protein